MELPTTKTPTIHQKSNALKVALSTAAPVVVLVYAAQSTMVTSERYGEGTTPFLLVGWCLVLLGCAGWLNHVLFRHFSSVLPFLAAIVTTLLIWLWQKLAFTALIPNGELKYGYFLNPGGAKARFWVLSCPLWVGLACLSICFIVALILGWRAGTRFSLACMIPWWLAAFVLCVLPSLYLDGQGNASIVI